MSTDAQLRQQQRVLMPPNRPPGVPSDGLRKGGERRIGTETDKDTPHILLDTNVWRALADANAGQRLSSAAARRGLTIAVAPSVVYETLRLEHVALRDRVLRIQTSRGWVRLVPEQLEILPK